MKKNAFYILALVFTFVELQGQDLASNLQDCMERGSGSFSESESTLLQAVIAQERQWMNEGWLPDASPQGYERMIENIFESDEPVPFLKFTPKEVNPDEITKLYNCFMQVSKDESGLPQGWLEYKQNLEKMISGKKRNREALLGMARALDFFTFQQTLVRAPLVIALYELAIRDAAKR